MEPIEINVLGNVICISCGTSISSYFIIFHHPNRLIFFQRLFSTTPSGQWESRGALPPGAVGGPTAMQGSGGETTAVLPKLDG